MEILKIEGTNNTPAIIMDNRVNLIEFSGESRPDNIREFFAPVYIWLNDYKSNLFYFTSEFNQNISIKVNFRMSYFNSSTVRVFNEILTELKKMGESNPKLSFVTNWYYEADDVDMKEAGEEIADLT